MKLLLTCVLLLFPIFAHAVDAKSGQCIVWLLQYNILPTKTWGSAPLDVQQQWQVQNCNDVICTYIKNINPTQAVGSMPPNLITAWDALKSSCN